MRRISPLVGILFLLGILVTISGGAARATERASRNLEGMTGSGAELVIVNGNGELRVRQEGEKVEAKLDGREVPSSRLVRTGKIFQVVGNHGETLFMFGLVGQGNEAKLVYAPDFDPCGSRARIGMTAAERAVVVPVGPGARQGNGEVVRPGTWVGHLLVVEDVAEGSPSAKAGLKPLDIITHLDGQEVESTVELQKRIAAKSPGEGVKLRIVRDAQPKEVEVPVAAVEEWPAPFDLEMIFRDALQTRRQ